MVTFAGINIKRMVHVSDLHGQPASVRVCRDYEKVETYCEVGIHVGVRRPLGFEDGKPLSLSNEVALSIRG